MDVTEFIDLLGGYQAAMTVLGVSRPLLALWEQQGIPTKRWMQITELARERGLPGLDLESVARIVPSKPRSSEAAD